MMIDSEENDIVCSGNEACIDIAVDGIKIASKNSNLFCNGRFACSGSVIDVTARLDSSDGYRKWIGSIYCGGNSGCHNTVIYSADTVYCTAYQSCYQSRMYNVSNVYLLAGAKLLTQEVGDFSIYNNYGLTLNVYFYAFNCGKGSNIWCNGTSDICNIECKYKFACHQVTLICHGTCNVCCDKTNTTKIVCPTVIGTGTVQYTS